MVDYRSYIQGQFPPPPPRVGLPLVLDFPRSLDWPQGSRDALVRDAVLRLGTCAWKDNLRIERRHVVFVE
jgi:hypothetical protein